MCFVAAIARANPLFGDAANGAIMAKAYNRQKVKLFAKKIREFLFHTLNMMKFSAQKRVKIWQLSKPRRKIAVLSRAGVVQANATKTKRAALCSISAFYLTPRARA